MLNLVLVEPRIPPNTGNVARLCAATGCALHLVEPLGFSLEDRYLRRAGLDYWPEVQLEVWKDFDTLRQAHPSATFRAYTTRVSRPYTRAAYREGDFLVFGSEPEGLPDRIVLELWDEAYTIPMWGKVRSLNLSTAVGVVAYEALRQVRGF